jgi:hypothetical protein
MSNKFSSSNKIRGSARSAYGRTSGSARSANGNNIRGSARSANANANDIRDSKQSAYGRTSGYGSKPVRTRGGSGAQPVRPLGGSCHPAACLSEGSARSANANDIRGSKRRTAANFPVSVRMTDRMKKTLDKVSGIVSAKALQQYNNKLLADLAKIVQQLKLPKALVKNMLDAILLALFKAFEKEIDIPKSYESMLLEVNEKVANFMTTKRLTNFDSWPRRPDDYVWKDFIKMFFSLFLTAFLAFIYISVFVGLVKTAPEFAKATNFAAQTAISQVFEMSKEEAEEAVSNVVLEGIRFIFNYVIVHLVKSALKQYMIVQNVNFFKYIDTSLLSGFTGSIAFFLSKMTFAQQYFLVDFLGQIVRDHAVDTTSGASIAIRQTIDWMSFVVPIPILSSMPAYKIGHGVRQLYDVTLYGGYLKPYLSGKPFLDYLTELNSITLPKIQKEVDKVRTYYEEHKRDEMSLEMKTFSSEILTYIKLILEEMKKYEKLHKDAYTWISGGTYTAEKWNKVRKNFKTEMDQLNKIFDWYDLREEMRVIAEEKLEQYQKMTKEEFEKFYKEWSKRNQDEDELIRARLREYSRRTDVLKKGIQHNRQATEREIADLKRRLELKKTFDESSEGLRSVSEELETVIQPLRSKSKSEVVESAQSGRPTKSSRSVKKSISSKKSSKSKSTAM